MLARFAALKRSDRLRAIGWIVLASGLAGAALLYWVEARTADPVIDDVTALGYRRSMQHGMGVMMGQFGIVLTGWQESLSSPIGQALMTAICAALVAGYFFRVAWVLDAEHEEN
jgi:hypothetical protein